MSAHCQLHQTASLGDMGSPWFVNYAGKGGCGVKIAVA
jgi:hypothetical protein